MKKLIDKFCSLMNRISWGKRVDATSGKFDIVPVSSCVELASAEVALNGKLKAKMGKILDEVRNCSLVSWDLWEMGNLLSPQYNIWDFNKDRTNCSADNNRIKYCDNKETFMSEMMGLSLAHDVVDIKLVKSMDKTHGIIMVLFCINGEGKTNIDADLIDLLASATSGAYV